MPSDRKLNKRSLGYQVTSLGNVADKLAEIAQDYTDDRYAVYREQLEAAFTATVKLQNFVAGIQKAL